LEVWFVPPGGGAFAHADAYASEIVVSAQMSGVKTWRMMMYPNASTVFDVVESSDGQIYGTDRWAPGPEFDVGPGECVVFPPGYYHETLVNKDKNTACTVATTFQFLRPFPTQYIRAFLPRLFHSHLQWQEAGADKHWSKYATLGLLKMGIPSTDEVEIRRRAEKLLRQADRDGDGMPGEEELTSHFEKLGHPDMQYVWAEQLSKKAYATARQQLLTALVLDSIHYHDTNGDQVISKDELFDSLQQWCVLMSRYQRLARLGWRTADEVREAKSIEEGLLKRFSSSGGSSTAEPGAEQLRRVLRFIEAARAERGEHEDEDDEDSRDDRHSDL